MRTFQIEIFALRLPLLLTVNNLKKRSESDLNTADMKWHLPKFCHLLSKNMSSVF